MLGRTERRGFALPLAILIIAVLTASVAAGFAATASEAGVNNAQRAQERAYQLAEAGLQQFSVRRTESGFCSLCQTDPGTSAVDSEYTRITLPGGYADVVAKRIRAEQTLSDPAIFFIRSRGVDTAALLSGKGYTTYAERTVGAWAKWNRATMQVQAALTSFNGVTISSTGTANSNALTSCDTTRTFDIVTPTSPGNSGIPGGVTTTTFAFATLTGKQAIDWTSLKASNGITYDQTISSGPIPVGNATWPIIHVTMLAPSLSLGTGQGLLVVDNDLNWPQGANWNGVILVGGKLLSTTTATNATINGAVVTGLNNTLVGAVLPSPGDIADNDQVARRHTIRYDPCNVGYAGQKLHAFTVMSNTWMDNVATW